MVLCADSDTAHSYLDSAHQLKLTFAHPESKVETGNCLWHLLQGVQSVSRYAAEFHTLVVHTTWGEATLCTGFYEGLAPRIKDEVADKVHLVTL